MLFLAWRWPLVLLAGSIALWAVTSRYGLNFPSYPNPAGWFFNPLAWQLLFTIGLLTGTAMKDGRRLVPVTPWLLVPAGAVLVLGLDLWVGGPWSGAIWDWQWQTLQAGTPEMLVGVEKTFLPLPRLIHALSLAYILSCFAVIRRACASRAAGPFALLGRNALAVFATGSVLNFAMQLVRVKTGVDFTLDTAMLAGGLFLLFALAAAKQYWPKI